MLAERQIRRLQAQHKEDRLKLLTGRAQKAIDDKMCDIDDFEDEEELQQLLHGQRQSQGRLDMTAVSQEKLLVASLNTVESLGQRLKNSSISNLNFNSTWGSMEDDPGPRRGRKGASPQQSQFPGASYLRGAMWIARNWCLLSDEMTGELDIFKNKHLEEISTARSDDNLRRCIQRLMLLAGAAVTEMVTIANKFKLRTDRIAEVSLGV